MGTGRDAYYRERQESIGKPLVPNMIREVASCIRITGSAFVGLRVAASVRESRNSYTGGVRRKFIEQRWPLSRIKEHCTPDNRTPSGYQNQVLEQYNYGSLLHEQARHGLGTIFWYATSQGKRNWTYSVNVQRAGDWWLLEIGTLTSDAEIADNPAFTAQRWPIVEESGTA